MTIYNYTMFDTHCHLNFLRFKKNLSEVISRAKEQGVRSFLIPGTDVNSSLRAIQIAEHFTGVYAAVGIHPHHVYESQNTDTKIVLKEIEKMFANPKVVAVGEVGLDRYEYSKTKYQNYQITDEFYHAQKTLFIEQIKLAAQYKKTLILHNRQSKKDLLEILLTHIDVLLTIPVVFHCCEPDHELLAFAKDHHIYIGVDGNVTYSKSKQEFVKKIPLELLVLETDSPFLLPEPLRSQKLYPNEPKNIPIIAEFIAKLHNVETNHIIDTTEQNAKKLFQLNNL